MLSNAVCCWSPQCHTEFRSSNSQRGLVESARWGENLLIWFTVPKNRRTSLTYCGVAVWTMP